LFGFDDPEISSVLHFFRRILNLTIILFFFSKGCSLEIFEKKLKIYGTAGLLIASITLKRCRNYLRKGVNFG